MNDEWWILGDAWGPMNDLIHEASLGDCLPQPLACARSPDWGRLFPEADFRLSMGLRPGDAALFWHDWSEGGWLAAERRHWLTKSPELYAGCLPEGVNAAAEARGWMRSFSADPGPDWVLMSADTETEPVVLAGEVVFPSLWSLPEKLGLPMSGVHEPVPGLHEKLGSGIHAFLSHLKSGAIWQRENWGLAADAELNHHPARALSKLTRDACPETSWIRLEHQSLTRLPGSGCILFGIRVTCHRLDEVAALPGMAARISHALMSMPEPLARYKGLLEARAALVAALR